MSRKTVWIIVPTLLTLVCAAGAGPDAREHGFLLPGAVEAQQRAAEQHGGFHFQAVRCGRRRDADRRRSDGGECFGEQGSVRGAARLRREPFAGDARWLDIQVRSPAGSGTFTPLSPRQELTPTPYASCAAKAAPNAITSAMLTSDAASLKKVSGDVLFSDPSHAWVGIGTDSPRHKLDVRGDLGIGTFSDVPLPGISVLYDDGDLGYGTTAFHGNRWSSYWKWEHDAAGGVVVPQMDLSQYNVLSLYDSHSDVGNASIQFNPETVFLLCGNLLEKVKLKTGRSGISTIKCWPNQHMEN